MSTFSGEPQFSKAINIHKDGKLSYSDLDSSVPESLSGTAGLMDSDLIDELFGYQLDLDALVTDLHSIAKNYSNFRDLILKKNFTFEELNRADPGYLSELETLRSFWESLYEEAVTAASNIRYRLKSSKRYLVRMKLWFARLGLGKVTLDDIAQERAIMEGEIEEVRKESKERIERNTSGRH